MGSCHAAETQPKDSNMDGSSKEKLRVLEEENKRLQSVENQLQTLQKEIEKERAEYKKAQEGASTEGSKLDSSGRGLSNSQRKESSPQGSPSRHHEDSLPDGSTHFVRQSSLIDKAITQYRDQARHTLVAFKTSMAAKIDVLPSSLKGCIFVGHTSTDMDSIGSAIAAAELFHGTAARASEINSETKFALEYWELPIPPLYKDLIEKKTEEEIKQEKSSEGLKVCLVDHNQSSQMAEGIDIKAIRGCIDHHALQSGTIVTDLPIYVDIKPWGSACTIIGNMFIQDRRAPSRTTAGLLLSGILSDTLNLHSPTTTETDKLVVSLLASVANVKDVNDLAQKMFKAKSRDLLTLSASQLVRGDLKLFKFSNKTVTFQIAFGVVETVDLEGLLGRKEEMVFELRAFKAEQKAEFAFLALVDIINLCSTLLVVSHGESSLAEKAYNGSPSKIDPVFFDLGKRVSRKKDFIPPLSDVLQSGWVPPPETLKVDQKEDFGELVHECTHAGCMVTRKSKIFPGKNVRSTFIPPNPKKATGVSLVVLKPDGSIAIKGQ